MSLHPFNGVRVAPLSCDMHSFQVRQITPLHQFGFRVLLLDSSHGRGRNEEPFDFELFANPPYDSCVGSAHWFTFEHDRTASPNQGGLADECMAHDPADVGGGEKRLSTVDVKYVFHFLVVANHRAAVAADDPFGRAGGA